MPMPGQILPPALMGGSANVGPAVQPQGNQGNAALAMIDVRNAISMLEKALPMVPIGAQLHTDILTATKTLSKNLSQGDDDQSLQLQSLLQLAKSNAQQTPIAALSRLYPGPSAPPAMGSPGTPLPGAEAPQPPEQQAA